MLCSDAAHQKQTSCVDGLRPGERTSVLAPDQKAGRARLKTPDNVSTLNVVSWLPSCSRLDFEFAERIAFHGLQASIYDVRLVLLNFAVDIISAARIPYGGRRRCSILNNPEPTFN